MIAFLTHLPNDFSEQFAAVKKMLWQNQLPTQHFNTKHGQAIFLWSKNQGVDLSVISDNIWLDSFFLPNHAYLNFEDLDTATVDSIASKNNLENNLPKLYLSYSDDFFKLTPAKQELFSAIYFYDFIDIKMNDLFALTLNHQNLYFLISQQPTAIEAGRKLYRQFKEENLALTHQKYG